MISFFQNEDILNIDIIVYNESWKNTQDQTTYHSRLNAFDFIFLEYDKARVYIFSEKQVKKSARTYKVDLTDIIILHIKFLDNQLHIHNIYNPLNATQVNTNVLILKQNLAKYPSGNQFSGEISACTTSNNDDQRYQKPISKSLKSC